MIEIEALKKLYSYTKDKKTDFAGERSMFARNGHHKEEL
jgi:hypothetical protein